MNAYKIVRDIKYIVSTMNGCDDNIDLDHYKSILNFILKIREYSDKEKAYLLLDTYIFDQDFNCIKILIEYGAIILDDNEYENEGMIYYFIDSLYDHNDEDISKVTEIIKLFCVTNTLTMKHIYSYHTDYSYYGWGIGSVTFLNIILDNMKIDETDNLFIKKIIYEIEEENEKTDVESDEE